MGTGDAGGIWRICWRISEEFAIYMIKYQYCAEYRREHFVETAIFAYLRDPFRRDEGSCFNGP